MKSKKGLWFGEETGKIVLAVIGIVLMIFLLVKIIGILIQKTKYEQAKAAMSEIEMVTSSLKEKEIGYVFIEGPKNWVLKRYSPYEDKQKIPSSCGNKECLCLCPPINFSWWDRITLIDFRDFKEINDEIIKNCQNKGVCKNLNLPLIITTKCYLNLPHCRELDKIPLMFTMQKNKGGIIISSHESFDATKFFSMIISNKTKFEILKNWSLGREFFNDRKIEGMLEETVKEYEKAHNIELEKWYVIIGKIKSDGSVDYSRWGTDLTITEWGCIKDIRTVIGMHFPALLMTDFFVKVSEGIEERFKSPSKRCLGGDWFSMIFYLEEGNNRQDLLFEIRLDSKNEKK